MYNITIIGTSHSEIGSCSSNELYKILENIRPELIFEEISPENFESYYSDSGKNTLETNAIKMYLKEHAISQIPVDNYKLNKLCFEDVNYMFDLMYDYSEEYTYLSEQHQFNSHQYGFKYLNSDKCDKITEKKRIIENDIIQKIKDERIEQIYNEWIKFNDERENTMIKNIYNYSLKNIYNVAIFILGADHKKPVIEKVKNIKENINLEIAWNKLE